MSFIRLLLHRGKKAKRRAKWGSIFELPSFAKGPPLQDVRGLIHLKPPEILPADVLRNMEKNELRLDETVELIAISTRTSNSTGVEGNEANKLYNLSMEADESDDLAFETTSKYLAVTKEMKLYGIEGLDG
ncbi:hypothetical protein COCVIDRAFT_31253 [Bipolaris victoriae FI3]|uniref:Uncharacterized protein n=1 Tax=Bipolaris victoriae (strain FI3) TaxID=930091 RepID=W7E6G4_BIPV3|nr:hypothetical protein COCVIDRAFT_31253 [Bipolaris victoriae FI3]